MSLLQFLHTSEDEIFSWTYQEKSKITNLKQKFRGKYVTRDIGQWILKASISAEKAMLQRTKIQSDDGKLMARQCCVKCNSRGTAGLTI